MLYVEAVLPKVRLRISSFAVIPQECLHHPRCTLGPSSWRKNLGGFNLKLDRCHSTGPYVVSMTEQTFLGDLVHRSWFWTVPLEDTHENPEVMKKQWTLISSAEIRRLPSSRTISVFAVSPVLLGLILHCQINHITQRFCTLCSICRGCISSFWRNPLLINQLHKFWTVWTCLQVITWRL